MRVELSIKVIIEDEQELEYATIGTNNEAFHSFQVEKDLLAERYGGTQFLVNRIEMENDALMRKLIKNVGQSVWDNHRKKHGLTP